MYSHLQIQNKLAKIVANTTFNQLLTLSVLKLTYPSNQAVSLHDQKVKTKI